MCLLRNRSCLGLPACAGPFSPSQPLFQRPPCRINEVWRLRWGNKWKEIWWRLLLHGVSGAGGHGIPWARGSACVCGWQAADSAACDVRALQQREHVFWSCPRAQAAVDVLAKNLPPETSVLPVHVWLLIPPCPNVNERVWWVACLCTLNSMRRLRYCNPQDFQEHASNFLVEGLKDFIACQGGQPSLAGSLSPGHPFIAVDQNLNLVPNLVP